VTVGTAAWIAAVRARESERPDRLFHDPYARVLAGDAGFAMMARSEAAAGGRPHPFIPVRVRWFDDLTLAAIPAASQVALLGAGLDSRPFRLEVPPGVEWFEVDQPAVLAAKDEQLAAAPPRGRRHAVGADLRDDWVTPLLGAGYDRRAPTLWLAEGLFFYLTEAIIVDLLRRACELSAPGSLFAADVIGTAGLDGPAMQAYRDYCARNDRPPPFGADDPAALFEAGGWEVRHVTAPGAPDANYGRFPDQPGGVIPGRTHLVIGGSR
jgi:methyltransferase (TIGR00027 family)